MMHGFLLIDKPADISTFDCIRKLRRVSNIRRMGFAGTLDPLATGLVILAVGESTKLLSYLEKADKVYEVLINLGAVSNTFDAQGVVVEKVGQERGDEPKNTNRKNLEKVLEESFLGPREQIPPKFSAIHVQGQRAYDLARKGQEVVMKPRQVHFFEIKIKSYSWPNLRLEVHCSSGTYIRSLAHDLGQNLGCGGYVKELRRLKVGTFAVKNATELGQIDPVNFSKLMLTPQEFFSDYRQLVLNEEQYKILANGGLIEVPGVLSFAPNVFDITAQVKALNQPILAIYNNVCVGVLETFQSKLKFERKFNI